MVDDRLLIDEAATLQIAASVAALRVQVEHSAAYLDFVASHVGHPDLVAELDARAAQLAEERERLGVLLDEVSTQLTDMVGEFTHADGQLGLAAPAAVGSPDAVEARAANGWEAMTGVYVDAD